jgi:hypothetical protein
MDALFFNIVYAFILTTVLHKFNLFTQRGRNYMIFKPLEHKACLIDR